MLDKGFFLSVDKHRAEVAELVDALGSGSSGGFSVPVQIRASAPKKIKVPFLFLGNPRYSLAVIIASVLASILSVVTAMTLGFAAVPQCAASVSLFYKLINSS